MMISVTNFRIEINGVFCGLFVADDNLLEMFRLVDAFFVPNMNFGYNFGETSLVRHVYSSSYMYMRYTCECVF